MMKAFKNFFKSAISFVTELYQLRLHVLRVSENGQISKFSDNCVENKRIDKFRKRAVGRF